MSSSLATVVTAQVLSRRNRVGLVLAALLAVVDLLGVVLPFGDPDQPGPPLFILSINAVLGLVTLGAVVLAWRTHRRAGSRIAAVSRIMAALTALPAFFVPDVPAVLVASAAVALLAAAASVYLLLDPPRASPDA